MSTTEEEIAIAAAFDMASRHNTEALEWIMKEMRFPSGKTERHWGKGYPFEGDG